MEFAARARSPQWDVSLTRCRRDGIANLAGGSGTPEALDHAVSEGAAGAQVGTLFAYTNESGFTADIKRRVIAAALNHTVQIRTDARASPTGYPFKIVIVDPEAPIFAPRERCCDLGYLREVLRDALGALRSDERAELRRRAAKPQGPRPLIR